MHVLWFVDVLYLPGISSHRLIGDLFLMFLDVNSLIIALGSFFFQDIQHNYFRSLRICNGRPLHGARKPHNRQVRVPQWIDLDESWIDGFRRSYRNYSQKWTVAGWFDTFHLMKFDEIGINRQPGRKCKIRVGGTEGRAWGGCNQGRESGGGDDLQRAYKSIHSKLSLVVLFFSRGALSVYLLLTASFFLCVGKTFYIKTW